jgi:UDP-N-acetylglucosamine/UDP-N-acetylgalactosamine 4-epimerase
MEAEGVAGRAYNVACGDRFTLNHLVREIGRMTGREVQPEYGPPRPGDVRHSMADISRAREELGYDVRVSFEEGLRRTIEFYVGGAAPASSA